MLVTLLPAVAGASAPKGMVEVREEILDNGLKVLLLENHRSPAVTFQVWYRVGSRNEVDGKSGIAHFLEHMLFKGTDKVARRNTPASSGSTAAAPTRSPPTTPPSTTPP